MKRFRIASAQILQEHHDRLLHSGIDYRDDPVLADYSRSDGRNLAHSEKENPSVFGGIGVFFLQEVPAAMFPSELADVNGVNRLKDEFRPVRYFVRDSTRNQRHKRHGAIK